MGGAIMHRAEIYLARKIGGRALVKKKHEVLEESSILFFNIVQLYSGH